MDINAMSLGYKMVANCGHKRILKEAIAPILRFTEKTEEAE
jgi:hypothetical protein